MWKEVEDERVRHVWRCSKCLRTAYVGPGFYAEAGEPMCPVECSEEPMEYVCTEVRDE